MNPAALSLRPVLLTVAVGVVSACSREAPQTLVTIADARTSPARVIDNGEPGDSAGDILVFDQPLLDAQAKTIGNNSGLCLRTDTGHSFQCQWTLSFDDGGIQVAGREFDQGPSILSIVGGTGNYAGIIGEMESRKQDDDTFRQTLRYRMR
jgi:hypothetical protein